MIGERYYPTEDISLASILIALGETMRHSDPVTCLLVNGGAKKYTFWFMHSDTIGKSVNEYATLKSGASLPDNEHPMNYMKGVLENRVTLLHWIKNNAAPLKLTTRGNVHVLCGQAVEQDTIKRMTNLVK